MMNGDGITQGYGWHYDHAQYHRSMFGFYIQPICMTSQAQPYRYVVQTLVADWSESAFATRLPRGSERAAGLGSCMGGNLNLSDVSSDSSPFLHALHVMRENHQIPPYVPSRLPLYNIGRAPYSHPNLTSRGIIPF